MKKSLMIATALSMSLGWHMGWAQSRGIECGRGMDCSGYRPSAPSRQSAPAYPSSGKDTVIYESIDGLGKTLDRQERAARLAEQKEQEERHREEGLQQFAAENEKLRQQDEQWRNDIECDFDKLVGSCSAIYLLENIVNDPQRISSRADLLIRSSSDACSKVEYFVDSTPHQLVLKNTDREWTGIWGTSAIDRNTISIKSCRAYARKQPAQPAAAEFKFNVD